MRKLAVRAAHYLTKGFIYGMVFGIAFLFAGLALEAIIAVLGYLSVIGWPSGAIPLAMFGFAFVGSIAVAFTNYLEAKEAEG